MRRRALAVVLASCLTLLLTTPLLAQPAPAPAPAPAPKPAAVVVPPKLISEPEVAYPEGASGDARVVLVIVVNPEGGVDSATPEVVHEPFSSSAALAAQGFRFTPATRDGVPIAAKIRFEVVFREPEPEPAPEPAEAPPAPVVEGAPPAPPIEEPLELDVLGERPEPSRSASLSRAEVRELPGAFGDPFRAIEALPGVTPIV
ncbi:MAG TPA: energy transducer TonB, partial [Polyangiaceae bacterium]|nr:energy transducer TonB [Polyangiaceae bacterium]